MQARYGRDPFGALLGQKEGTNPALGTMNDLHSDLVATFSSTALATTTAYDPFGTVIAQTGVKTNLGYQGEYTDPDTGKVNMHARWYQPGTGTFTSRDTWTLNPQPSVQANRYTYANASPLTGTDPSGHEVLRDIDGGWEYNAGACSMYGGYCDSEWIPDVGFNPSWSEEEARRVNVIPEGPGAGRNAPKGFWTANPKARQFLIDSYNDAFSQKQLDALWEMAKAMFPHPAMGAGASVLNINQNPADPKVWRSCAKAYGTELCKAWRILAITAVAVQDFGYRCANVARFATGKMDFHACAREALILGISEKEWKKLINKNGDHWIVRLLNSDVMDFFFGDAARCVDRGGSGFMLERGSRLSGWRGRRQSDQSSRKGHWQTGRRLERGSEGLQEK